MPGKRLGRLGVNATCGEIADEGVAQGMEVRHTPFAVRVRKEVRRLPLLALFRIILGGVKPPLTRSLKVRLDHLPGVVTAGNVEHGGP
jgi:hypothetical protein